MNKLLPFRLAAFILPSRLKNLFRSIEEIALPSADLGRVNLVLLGKLGKATPLFQGFQDHFGLELGGKFSSCNIQ